MLNALSQDCFACDSSACGSLVNEVLDEMYSTRATVSFMSLAQHSKLTICALGIPLRDFFFKYASAFTLHFYCTYVAGNKMNLSV